SGVAFLTAAGPNGADRIPQAESQPARHAVNGREMLLHVLTSGERHLPAQRLIGAGRAAVVEYRHLRKMDDVPAGLSHPKAEVGFLAIEKEPLVQDTDIVDRRPACQHERTDGPVAERLMIVELQVEHTFSEPPGTNWKSF